MKFQLAFTFLGVALFLMTKWFITYQIIYASKTFLILHVQYMKMGITILYIQFLYMDMEFWSYIQYFSLKSNALSRLQKCPNYHTANTSDYPAEKKKSANV